MNLSVLKTFDNYFTANILLTRLQADGVECYLKDENTVTIDPLLSNAIGGIKLMVRAEELGTARQLLQAYDNGFMESAICPQCGTNNFRQHVKATGSNVFNAVLSILSLPFSKSEEQEYRCGNCGYVSDMLT